MEGGGGCQVSHREDAVCPATQAGTRCGPMEQGVQRLWTPRQCVGQLEAKTSSITNGYPPPLLGHVLPLVAGQGPPRPGESL